jgi:hypothetical protein
MIYVAVFIFVCLSDMVWTYYISAVAKGKPFLASLFSSLTVFMGLMATIMVVADQLAIVPAMLGAFLGTYVTVRAVKGGRDEM